jgi:hypothetical protein
MRRGLAGKRGLWRECEPTVPSKEDGWQPSAHGCPHRHSTRGPIPRPHDGPDVCMQRQGKYSATQLLVMIISASLRASSGSRYSSPPSRGVPGLEAIVEDWVNWIKANTNDALVRGCRASFCCSPPRRRGSNTPRSYHPLLAFCTDTKEILQAWLRTGSAYTSNGIVEFLMSCYLAAGPYCAEVSLFYRADKPALRSRR